jgi:hypothetical protein
MNAPEEPRGGGPYPPPEDYGYSQVPAYGAPPAQPRNGFGIAALVLGVLAFLLSWTVIGGILLGILALIFGLLGRARAKRGEATNSGLSVAGIVLGIVGMLIAIGLGALMLFFFNSPAARSYQQCLQQSGGDPAKIQQCASDLSRQLGGG